jgi:hypothetical protein
MGGANQLSLSGDLDTHKSVLIDAGSSRRARRLTPARVA